MLGVSTMFYEKIFFGNSSPLQWFVSQIKLYLFHPQENSTKHLTLLPAQLTSLTRARIQLIYAMPRPASDYEIN